ncbi:MAG: hypothetical protein WBG53_01370 [Rhodococcus sp. (in: high G+C Gram-positive bacteria)]
MTTIERTPEDVRSDILSEEQLGHLRHFDNLSRNLPNDWSLMHGKAGGQDDFGSFRFQLAYMTYAMALTYRHRLPNAPGVFKPVFERLIDKMLLPEVWSYWHDTSRGGFIMNAHLSGEYREQWNPVVKDNIMYSAYVQSMALMYNYLFADDRYAEPGALTFDQWTFYWGGEGHRFEYDQNSLNETVYWQMVESGYLGVACEPNCVFQICNQPAILGFRMHDLLNGGSTAEEVTESYEKVWSELGRLDQSGHYNMMVLEDSRTVIPTRPVSAWTDAWCGSLMNMWNSEYVHTHYASQIGDLVFDGPDGTMSVHPSPDPEAMGRVGRYDSCDFGWTTVWSSEMGDDKTLESLLRHADRFMMPTWRDGGLYYPRNDTATDSDGHRTEVEPMTGNVLLGYARLNVPDGLNKFYNEPWDASRHSEPSLVEVGGDVSVSQARFDSDTSVLHFRITRHEDRSGDGRVLISNVPNDREWSLYEGDEQVASASDGDVSASRTDGGLAVVLRPGRPHALRLVLGAAR